MRSADLPVGAHVAYNSGSSNYKHIKEAYVFAVRGKGDKTSYWGGRTGNTDTIGIAYTAPYFAEEDGTPVWRFEWVRPHSIEHTWDEYQEISRIKLDRDAAIAKRRAEDQASRQAQVARIPASVIEALALSDYQIESMVERGQYSYTLTLDRIEAVIKAVQELG